MSDAPAFFRAIEADPADDTPRLVYADWLDEHARTDADRARAEFVRVQCELARDPDSPRRAELAARERELLSFAPAWAGSWRTALVEPTYRRGFLDPVAVAGDAFANCASLLADLTPLHHLRLVRVRGQMTPVVACPQLASVRRLSLCHAWVRNVEITAFAASPHLGSLRSLDVSHNQVGITGATDLAVARMPELRELDVERNPLKDRGLLAVAQADWPKLESLDASECGLTDAGVIALAESPLIPRLVWLRLSRNAGVTTAAWARLAQAPLARLERLELNSVVPDDAIDDAAEALAANPALANLRVLHLGAVTITDRGARAILDSPHLIRLADVRLWSGGYGITTWSRLIERFGERFSPR
jgi:uncharacterized protein (TIGR02996 family)